MKKKFSIVILLTIMFVLCACNAKQANETTEKKSKATVSANTKPKEYKEAFKSFHYNVCKEEEDFALEGIEIGGTDTLKLTDLYDFFDKEDGYATSGNIMAEFVRISPEIKHIEALSPDKFQGGEQIQVGLSGTLMIETDTLSPRDLFNLTNGLITEDIIYKDKQYDYSNMSKLYHTYFPHLKKEQGIYYADGIVFGIDNHVSVLRIPENITEVAPYAFCSPEEKYSVKKVYLPNSLRTLGYNAFAEQENIEYIDLGKGVEEIGAEAICGDVKKLIVPSTVKRIGYDAFGNLNGEHLKELIFEGNTKDYLTEDIEEIFFEDCDIENTTFTFREGMKQAFALVGSYTLKSPKKQKHSYLMAKWTKVTGADGYKVVLEDLNGGHLSTSVYQTNAATFTLPRDIDYIRVYITPYQTADGKKVYGRKTQYCIDECAD